MHTSDGVGVFHPFRIGLLSRIDQLLGHVMLKVMAFCGIVKEAFCLAYLMKVIPEDID